MSEDEVQIRPVSLIKGFGEVNLDNNGFFVQFLDQMKVLLSGPYGFTDLTVAEERKLFFGNHPG